jgi:type VI protein secretion system component VasF
MTLMNHQLLVLTLAQLNTALNSSTLNHSRYSHLKSCTYNLVHAGVTQLHCQSVEYLTCAELNDELNRVGLGAQQEQL